MRTSSCRINRDDVSCSIAGLPAMLLGELRRWYPMAKGQSAATAPRVVGDWVGFQLNGGSSETNSSSIVVANQNDAKNTKTIFPFGELKKGEWSFAPPKAGADPENSMIYSADMVALFTENYKEQLTWRVAATGEIVAESDVFDPLTINLPTPPGFGGRIYFPSAVGKGFFVLQAMPKSAAK